MLNFSSTVAKEIEKILLHDGFKSKDERYRGKIYIKEFTSINIELDDDDVKLTVSVFNPEAFTIKTILTFSVNNVPFFTQLFDLFKPYFK